MSHADRGALLAALDVCEAERDGWKDHCEKLLPGAGAMSAERDAYIATAARLRDELAMCEAERDRVTEESNE